MAFEVAEHDRRAIALWQLAEFLVEGRGEVGRDRFRPGTIRRDRQHAGAALVTTAASHIGPGVDGDPQGDTMQPAPDGLLPAHGNGSSDEDQKGCLERVFGVVLVAQNRAADAEDHRPVPIDQGGERRSSRLVPPLTARQAAEQVSIGQSADRARVEKRPDVIEQNFSSSSR